MENSSRVAMKCKFIKNTYALWLATEIYKSLADINPDLMKPYFVIKEMLCNLQNGCALKLPSGNSTYYGINSAFFRACYCEIGYHSPSSKVSH